MPGEKRRLAFFALLIAAFALLSYSQFFGIRLLEFDAVGKIASHSSRSPAEIINILTQPEQNYTLISTNYRPVQTLIQWAVFLLFGFDFSAFHWLNFLFHAVNSVLVFFVARKLLGDKPGFFSFLAGLVFALHPIHLNTVLFVSRLHEPLVAFALLSSLLCLGRYFERKKRVFFLLSFLFCAMGVFSKETGSLIPFVLFFYALVFSREKRFRNAFSSSLRFCLPFFSLVALYAAMMFFSLGRAGGYLSFAPAAPGFIAFSFFQFLVYPFDFLKAGFLESARPALTYGFSGIVFFVAILALSIVAAKFLSESRERKPALFLFCWLIVFLLAFSASGFIGAWYSYVPAIPFSMLLAFLLRVHCNNSKKSNLSRLAVAIIGLLVFSIVFFSPLFTDYPAPREAADATQSILGQTLLAAKDLPDGARLYLVNCPSYLFSEQLGFRNAILLVNESSAKAFLDFFAPDKNFKLFPITAVSIFSHPQDVNLDFRWKGNCVFVVENLDTKSAKNYLPVSAVNGPNMAKGVTFRPPQYGAGTEPIEIEFWKSEDWRDSFLLVFEGGRASAISISEFCKAES